MKTKQAVKALQEGKCIHYVASDPPVHVYDPVDAGKHVYQLLHNNVVIKLLPDVTCASKVLSTMTLENFESRSSYEYLNFEEVI